MFQREVSHLFNGKYVSVSGVRVTPDLGQARIHLSLLLVKDGQELLQEVQANTKTIRHHLAQRIKNQVRAIPELIFYLDDSAEYAAKMDKIIGELNIPPAEEDGKGEAHGDGATEEDDTEK